MVRIVTCTQRTHFFGRNESYTTHSSTNATTRVKHRLVLSWDRSSGSFIFLKDKSVNCDGIRRVLGWLVGYIDCINQWWMLGKFGALVIILSLYIYTFIGLCGFLFFWVCTLICIDFQFLCTCVDRFLCLWDGKTFFEYIDWWCSWSFILRSFVL